MKYLTDEKVITPSTDYVVSLAAMKQHSRITYNTEDALISEYLRAAERHIEDLTGRALLTQTREAVYSGFPYEIVLPTPDVASITSVYYLDDDEVSTLLASTEYLTDRLDLPWRQARLQAVTAWPTSTSDADDVLRVRYVCGYGDDPAVDVPATIRQAVRMLAAHWCEHREAFEQNAPTAVPAGILALIEPERFRRDFWSDE